jgi:short-subunit dehydrogenase
MNEAKLDGKNCVITGATGGIGKKISEILASNGCNLFLISTNEKKLSELRLQIENSSNVKIHTFATDLSILENLKNTISEVRNFFEKVDILINSAGIFNVDPLLNSTIEKFEKNFNLNVRAPFYLARIFSQDMVQQKWGRIVNLGSSSSYTGFKNGSIYCTTKHAILGLSRSLHAELKEDNVRCYCISPSSTRTDMGKISSDQNFETFLDPSDVAESIKFVISFDENLVIDEIRLNRMKIE